MACSAIAASSSPVKMPPLVSVGASATTAKSMTRVAAAKGVAVKGPETDAGVVLPQVAVARSEVAGAARGVDGAAMAVKGQRDERRLPKQRERLMP